MNVLRMVSAEVGLDDALDMARLIAGELSSEDHLVAHATRLHPLANPLFGFSELVVYRGVNEVAALRIEVVKDLEEVKPGSSEIGGGILQTLCLCYIHPAFLSKRPQSSWHPDIAGKP